MYNNSNNFGGDLMDFNKIDPLTYDKYTFGKCIRKQREEQGVSVRGLAKNLHISPMYLSDIERGNRYAPVKGNILSGLIEYLNIPESQVNSFYDMANATKGYSEYNKYLMENRNARLFLRKAMEMELSSLEWDALNDMLDDVINNRESKKKIKYKSSYDK